MEDNLFPKQNRCALVIAWQGPWRPWINLWIETCRWNPNWAFFVFSNQPPPTGAKTAQNIQFVQLNLKEFEQRFVNFLGRPFPRGGGYKFCDFKPTYGQLFADYLKPFTHWGYCDEDMFFGQLDGFFTDQILNDYDIITSCRCCIVGQFTIFKNRTELRTLYTQIPAIDVLLADPGYKTVDENILNSYLLTQESSGKLRVLRKQMQTHDVHSEEWQRWADDLEQREYGHPHGLLIHGPAVWSGGKINNLATGKEFAFFHFGSWKKLWAMPTVKPLPPYIGGWITHSRGLSFLRKDNASAFPFFEYVVRFKMHSIIRRVHRTGKRNLFHSIHSLRQRKADWARNRENAKI
jgi:hypothetical protein